MKKETDEIPFSKFFKTRTDGTIKRVVAKKLMELFAAPI